MNILSLLTSSVLATTDIVADPIVTCCTPIKANPQPAPISTPIGTPIGTPIWHGPVYPKPITNPTPVNPGGPIKIQPIYATN